MLIALVTKFFRERAVERAIRAFRAERAALPINEVERAGIMCNLRGSFTLPFSR
jgi:hypothetical protein